MGSEPSEDDYMMVAEGDVEAIYEDFYGKRSEVCLTMAWFKLKGDVAMGESCRPDRSTPFKLVADEEWVNERFDEFAEAAGIVNGVLEMTAEFTAEGVLVKCRGEEQSTKKGKKK